MKHDFSGIDNFKDWKTKQGRRFRSNSDRAFRYQNGKYESEYYWPIIKARSIPTLTASFHLIYGSTGVLENLIPTTSMLNFITKSEELTDIYHQPVVLSAEHGIEYKK